MRHWRSSHRCHIAAGTAIHWSFSMRITSSKTLGSGAPQPQSTIAKTPRTNIRLKFFPHFNRAESGTIQYRWTRQRSHELRGSDPSPRGRSYPFSLQVVLPKFPLE